MNDQRIVLGVEYDGSHFCGWQRQGHCRSVQEVLEQALSQIANRDITVACAGRTDAGVHAIEQIVHFDTTVSRSMSSWLLGTNSLLPDDVRVLWVKPARPGFHARYSALARLYRYVIDNRPVKSAFRAKQATWCHPMLSAEAMHEAAQFLVGHHDFSSFRAKSCQSLSPYREVHFIRVSREGDQVIIEVAANAFLHHMVRNIVGTLMWVGQGKKPIPWVAQLLALKQRSAAGMTAPPEGLYLAAVCYPDEYGLEKAPSFIKLPNNVKRFDGTVVPEQPSLPS